VTPFLDLVAYIVRMVAQKEDPGFTFTLYYSDRESTAIGLDFLRRAANACSSNFVLETRITSPASTLPRWTHADISAHLDKAASFGQKPVTKVMVCGSPEFNDNFDHWHREGQINKDINLHML